MTVGVEPIATNDVMEHPIPLSTKVGEVMAPQRLVAALIVGPDGHVTLDPGALHGRSELEQQIAWVQRRELVGEGQSCWMVWVAIELDAANQPVRYAGVSACELWVNPQTRRGYKSVAEFVNCMSEAMRGGVQVSRLAPQMRAAVTQQLMTIGPEVWERSADSLKRALES